MSEPVTAAWLWQRFPPTQEPKNPHVAVPIYNARYPGRYGSVVWQGAKDSDTIQLWINGNYEELGTLTVQRLLLICAACEIPLPYVQGFDNEG